LRFKNSGDLRRQSPNPFDDPLLFLGLADEVLGKNQAKEHQAQKLQFNDQLTAKYSISYT